MDALLALLGLLLSWPVLVLVAAIILRKELPGILSQLAERMTKAPGGFEFEALQRRVEYFAGKVEKVDEIAAQVERLEHEMRFLPTSELTAAVEGELRRTLAAFTAYLTRVGFAPPADAVDIEVSSGRAGTAWYDQTRNLIHLSPDYARDPDIALRQYTHHALSSILEDEGIATVGLSFANRPMQYGLADYYPASFKNDPRMGRVVAKDAHGGDYLRTLDNDYTFETIVPDPLNPDWARGEVWAGAFWEIRSLLGQERADRLLLAAWQAEGRGRSPFFSADEFVDRLVDALPSDAPQGTPERMRAIFDRRAIVRDPGSPS